MKRDLFQVIEASHWLMEVCGTTIRELRMGSKAGTDEKSRNLFQSWLRRRPAVMALDMAVSNPSCIEILGEGAILPQMRKLRIILEKPSGLAVVEALGRALRSRVPGCAPLKAFEMVVGDEFGLHL